MNEAQEEYHNKCREALGLTQAGYKIWLRERGNYLRGEELYRQQLFDQQCLNLYHENARSGKYNLPKVKL